MVFWGEGRGWKEAKAEKESKDSDKNLSDSHQKGRQVKSLQLISLPQSVIALQQFVWARWIISQHDSEYSALGMAE